VVTGNKYFVLVRVRIKPAQKVFQVFLCAMTCYVTRVHQYIAAGYLYRGVITMRIADTNKLHALVSFTKQH